MILFALDIFIDLIMILSNILISWYENHARVLPWRETKDPYYIWVSEIILQQTRVDQGLPYYFNFIKNFPDIEKLAIASEEHIMKVWQGLGYYSRARNMHYTAKHIVENYNSLFPSDYQSLLSLKGVGEYTASAIASFSFDLPYAVLDGNVIRILSRFYGVRNPYDTSKGKKIFQDVATQNLNVKHSSLHNQAIMEFGALMCVPRNPDCNICPLNSHCFAYNNGIVDLLPVKSKVIKVKERHLNYFIIRDHKYTYIKKREKGIWQGLFDFPCIESPLSSDDIMESQNWKDLFDGYDVKVSKISKIIKHQITHQKLLVRFWHLNLKSYRNMSYIKLEWRKINKYPVPKIIDKYLSFLSNFS